MKKFFILLLLCIGFTDVSAVAQTIEQVSGVPQNETKAGRKAREKRLQALADSISYVEASNAIDANYFVITADKISLGNSGHMYMTPDGSTNFILVQGSKSTIQLAFNNGRMGQNGLGGVTVEGTVSGMKKKITKKGDIHYDFNVQGVGVSAQVNVVVYKGSNSASAYVNPNFSSDKMTVYGPLVPYDMKRDKTKTFIGNTLP